MTDRRFALQALLDVSGLTEAALSRKVGLSGSTLKRARSLGLVEEAADRYAVRAGLLPWLVWPEWMEASIEASSIACAGCDIAFLPARPTQRYCSEPCRLAAKARRRWARDAEHRSRRLVYMAEWRATKAAEERAARRRECATRGCHVTFEPLRADQVYCSARCRGRQKMRRYRGAA